MEKPAPNTYAESVYLRFRKLSPKDRKKCDKFVENTQCYEEAGNCSYDECHVQDYWSMMDDVLRSFFDV